MELDKLIFDRHNDCFEVTGIRAEKGVIVVQVNSMQKYCVCPSCRDRACKLHSYYYRTIKDLPAFDNKIVLRLRSRKFYCDNKACQTRVFTERYKDHFSSYKRISNRLEQKLLKIALLMGGNAGAKMCNTLHITASSSTLIRQIHRKKLPEIKASEAVGVDDWAFRKGVSYGTAIVDLKKRRIIDLLPNREMTTVQDWLQKRTNIKVVTRDRYSQYVKGVTNGLPHAIQVADRWHLIKNLGDALQKILTRCRQELRRRNKNVCIKAGNILVKPVREIVIPAQLLHAGSNCQRTELLLHIKQLHQQGMPKRQIARTLNMSRVTVRKYLGLQEAPRKNEGKTNIYRFLEYIQTSMREDPEIEIMQLWKEVAGKGYNGSRSTFYHHLKEYVKPVERVKLPRLNDVSWLPSKVSLLLYKKEKLLSQEERALIKKLKSKSSEINESAILVAAFREIVERKEGNKLRKWITKVQQSGISELKGFAKGLLNDYKAVRNALGLHWSNGQVEGQINKLKMIKRQMYGRASFELLRKRILLEYG